MMMLLSALLAPILLNRALSWPGAGTRQASRQVETRSLCFAFPSFDVATLVTDTMTHQLQAEGFFVRTMDIEDGIAQVRKDDTAFSMQLRGDSLEVQGPVSHLPVAQIAVFEAVASLNTSFSRLKSDFDPVRLQRQLADSINNADDGAATVRLGSSQTLNVSQAAAINPFCISLQLKGDSKEAVIRELLESLLAARRITSVDTAFAAIMEREASMSTGMQDGIAIPHAKTDSAEQLVAAVGLKPEGMDFGSLDGHPTRIIVLSLSSKSNPGSHLQFLAAIGTILRDPTNRQRILAARNAGEIAKIFGV